MELTKLENVLASPEQPRTKRGLPQSNNSDMSASVERHKVSRTPNKIPANETVIAPKDFPVIVRPVRTEKSILPAESDEEVDNAVESEAAETVEPVTTEIQAPKSADHLCIADGVSPNFQTHLTFSVEMYRYAALQCLPTSKS